MNSRQGSQTRPGLAEELADARIVVVPVAQKADFKCGHPLRSESGIDRQKPSKTLGHQSRAREQRDGQGHFGDHQQTVHPVASPPPERSSDCIP